MTGSDIEVFCRQMECNYDGERYSVRDNGAVFRHPRQGKRQRPMDAQWTFGKPNEKTGYVEIAGVRVHRIVATAFHGLPPTPKHVVDHIDTNCRNNRPENLRWLTRLENALLNPITVKRIEFYCGSIEAFLEDPSRLRHGSLDRNIEWMRTVSAQEAQACRERMYLWAKSDKPSAGGGSLGEWVFKPSTPQNRSPETVTVNPQIAQACREHMQILAASEPLFRNPDGEVKPEPVAFQKRPATTLHEPPALVMAKTPGAAQRNWSILSEFPCCTQGAWEEPLAAYAERLKKGAIFARNDKSVTAVLDVAMTDDRQSLWVICEQRQENAVKPWALAKVTFEDGLYIHESRGTFFDKLGAEKQFCLAQGREWTGGDSIDDYC